MYLTISTISISVVSFCIFEKVSSASLSASLSSLTSYPAYNPTYFTWLGRTVPSLTGGVTFDLEGTTLEFSVTNATFIGLSISDSTFGGAKLGVYLDSTSGYYNSYTNSDPDSAGKAIPGLRVSTLLTSPFQTLYTLGSGGQITFLNSSNTLNVKVVNMAEYSMIGSRSGGFNITVNAILTDGTLIPTHTSSSSVW
jgi:hypothetical protein